MSSGEKLLAAREKTKLTRNALAEKAGVSFHAVSNWEQDESLPDMENIIQLAKVLDVSVDSLMEEESEEQDYAFVLRERMFSEEQMYAYIEATAISLGLSNTLQALPYMKEAHRGQYRKYNDGSMVPYIYHPLMITCHALALGIEEDNVLAAGLLHDVLEDCDILPEELPVDAKIRRTVMLLTKPEKKDGSGEQLSRVSNDMLDKYYEGIHGSRDAMVIKILDRCNNVSSMTTGFTKDRMAEYIKETEIYILPMLEILRSKFPEFYNMVFLVRYQMLSVLESLKRTL